MKILKVHPHWKAHDYGFSHCLRFPSWNDAAKEVDRVATRLLGLETFSRKNSPWFGEFGSRATYGTRLRPYRVYFRSESVISLILLSADQNNLHRETYPF
jgi:hypothetical protein